MRGKRKISGQNWELDGSTITVHIPMTWKRHGGRKVIIPMAAILGRRRSHHRTKRRSARSRAHR
jgi:hypothetical protein